MRPNPPRTPTAPQCREDSPVRCLGRANAMQAEEFFRVEGFGWFWTRAHSVLTPWSSCPFCGGRLPTMEGVVKGYIENGWPNPEE